MSTAENLVAPPLTPRARTTTAISAATLGVIAAALLVYVSSSFQLADMFSAKRVMQILLLGPIGAVAAYCVASKPSSIVNPLVMFATLKVIVEIALRGRVSYVVDSVAAMLGVIVVSGVPPKSFEIGAKVLVTASGFLALLAIIQCVILIYSPSCPSTCSSLLMTAIFRTPSGTRSRSWA